MNHRILYHNDHIEIQEEKSILPGFIAHYETIIEAYKLSDIPQEYFDNKFSEDEIDSIHWFFHDLEELMNDGNPVDEFQVISEIIKNSNEYEDSKNEN